MVSLKRKTGLAVRVLGRAVALALVVGSGSASATSLLEAYNAALVNDPQFRAAVYEAEAGKEYRILGRSALLPNLGASYSGSKNRADIERKSGLNDTTEHPDYISRSAYISLRQPLLSAEALARYKQGVAQSDYSEKQFASRTQEMVLRLVAAYIDALFAREQLKLAQGNRDTLLEQMKVNNRLFEKGEGTRTDMLETQARLDVAEAQVIESADNEAATRATLSGIVGAEVEKVDTVKDGFATKPLSQTRFEDWKALALSNNPELQAYEANIEIAKQEINKARAGHLPRVDFVATYSKNTSDTINTLNTNTTTRSLGVQVNIPLYSGGQVNASTRQAVAGRERARADLQARTDKTLVELRKSLSQVVNSTAKLAALDKAVASGQLLMRATEQSIKGGVRINLDLLNAQQHLYTSQRDQAQARYDYLLGLVRLRAAAGTLSPADVRELDSYFQQ